MGRKFRLSPKDPDPYPNFFILRVDETGVDFQKGSSHHLVRVDLRKISEITDSREDQLAHIRVLGRIVLSKDVRPQWRFVPTGAVGRPRRTTTAQ